MTTRYTLFKVTFHHKLDGAYHNNMYWTQTLEDLKSMFSGKVMSLRIWLQTDTGKKLVYKE